jgi:hypothetical protein
MKKIYYSVVVLTLLSIFFFTGCKKVNEGPFPSPPNAGGTYTDLAYTTPSFPTIAGASGILIAAQVHDQKTVIVTPFQNNYEYGMAEFASSPGNFSSLISANSVSLNANALTASNNNSYLSSTSNYTIGLSGSTSWQIQGNSSIPTFNYTLNGVYPSYADSFQNWDNNWLPVYPRSLPIVPAQPTVTHINDHSSHSDSTYYNQNLSTINTFLSDSLQYATNFSYNKAPQWTVPIRGYVFNADSVYIILKDGTGFFYQTKVATTVDSVAFSPNTFTGCQSSYDVTSFIMQINAIKYRDTVTSNGKYYFLKMGSYIKYYGATH